jgi:hypothetical protein
MAHSPSDLWRLVESFGFMTVEECISIRLHNGTRRVLLQLSIDGERHHQEVAVANPLTMLAVIDKFRQQRDSLRADQVRRHLAEEQAKIMENFLQKQRDEIARLHRERAVKYVRGPIQAILKRCKPVVDQFSYTNVYGKPAEVSFH